MVKSVTSFATFFVFLVLLGTFEMRTVLAQQRWCEVLSGTWSGWCDNSDHCDRQCREWEHYDHGSCVYRVPFEQCMCYYQC
ncbi:hypothetical protein AQUCO_00700779v1 [Aquilegia coerulea]|uniref:Knottins-like domain-containing protein n=1 Tax=Aquilegia coerulea TaxID=218851 RepID=A0A2G5ELM1_AQUCA|nr:hypothetical protein AQUCO_00700779v1 [Aquilegia coerulea]